jgi:U4/U6.U5 tri-snRNP-associated protein 1
MIRNENNSQKMKINHNVKSINEDTEYVLTLKDRNILENNDDDLEVLENAILSDLNKNKNKFNNDIDIENSDKKFIYDDKDKDDGFILPIDENIPVTDLSRDTNEIHKIREKLKGIKDPNKNQSKMSLANDNISYKNNPLENPSNKFSYGKNTPSDYMTEEEFKNYSNNFGLGLKKFKRKTKNKGTTILDPVSKDELKDILIKKNFTQNTDLTNKEDSNQVFHEYDELNLFLEKQNKEKKKNVMPEEHINELIETSKESSKNVIPVGDTNQEVTEYLTETSEFLKKVPNKKEIEENYKLITSATSISLKDIKSGTASVVNLALPNERLRHGIGSVISIQEDNKKFLNRKRTNDLESLPNASNTPSENESLNETVDQQEDSDDILNEPHLGKGVSVALEVLRKRGLIGRTEMWGRYKDKAYTTNEFAMTGKNTTKLPQQKKEINIEYRDAKGRILTPKEKFRNQCYVFHGKGPGRKKIEKRLIRAQLEEKMKNRDVSETNTFKYLKSQQLKKNTALVVIQGKNTNLI